MESKEIKFAPALTAEEVRAEFFDTDALRAQPESVYRMNVGGARYYYKFLPSGQPKFYKSVTTFIRQTMPTDPQLVKWMAEMGYDESRRYSEERAAYGTFMHKEIAAMLIAWEYDLDKLESRLAEYVEAEKLQPEFMDNAEELRHDILAFAQFAIDTKFKPVAIEMILTDDEAGIAGALDLVGYISIEEKGYFGEVYKSGANAGKPKQTKRELRCLAIIDEKSGRKAFYPEYEVQLAAYQMMWNKQFPDMPVEKVYNWSPKEWRTTPGYNLKDQTGTTNAQKLPYLIALKNVGEEKDKSITTTSGVINLKAGDLSANITSRPLAQLVQECHQEATPGAENITAAMGNAVKPPVTSENILDGTTAQEKAENAAEAKTGGKEWDFDNINDL